jgi:hypothetical protein
MANVSITTETLNSVPGFTPPNFGAVDFGIPANGIYSAGYKMIAFEPGKILQAQELNEIQFRMNVEQTLTHQMFANWLNALINYGSSSSTGPGWEGATPLDLDLLTFNPVLNTLTFNIIPDKSWYLCNANSFGLYFWLYLKTNSIPQFSLTDIPQNNFIGFSLNTTANETYTGELATCDTVGSLGNNHPLNVRNTSTCGSGRYYIKITGITTSDTQITNGFVAIAQNRSDGLYYLNNIKVKEITG